MSFFNDEQMKRRVAARYGIEPEQVLWYHSGICYDRVLVTTREAAEKVKAAVKGKYVNGGMLHGMELGLYQEIKGNFDVMV